MKVVFKKTIAEEFLNLIKTEIDEKNIPYELVDHISISEDGAVAIYDYYASKVINPRYKLSRQLKINEVHNSHFFGYKVKVEGLD